MNEDQSLKYIAKLRSLFDFLDNENKMNLLVKQCTSIEAMFNDLKNLGFASLHFQLLFINSIIFPGSGE